MQDRDNHAQTASTTGGCEACATQRRGDRAEPSWTERWSKHVKSNSNRVRGRAEHTIGGRGQIRGSTAEVCRSWKAAKAVSKLKGS